MEKDKFEQTIWTLVKTAKELDESDSQQQAVSCILHAMCGAYFYSDPKVLHSLWRCVHRWSGEAINFIDVQKRLR